MTSLTTFQTQIKQGIPAELPPAKPYLAGVNRAPKRKDILTSEEKQLALRNALRYFPKRMAPRASARICPGIKRFWPHLYVSL